MSGIKYILLIFMIGLMTLPCLSCSPHETQNTFRGTFIWGHEVRTFRPCNKQETYWVKTSQELMNQLRQDYEKVSSRPYQPSYIEFKGNVTIEERTGFAADYDGLIYIHDLIKAPQDMPAECD